MAINHEDFTEAHLRPAVDADSAHLAILADMATRGLSSFLWGLAASAGQSRFEVGRASIRHDTDSLLHYPHWHVAERARDVLGAVNGYILRPHPSIVTHPDAARTLQPLNELKSLAKGSWYIAALSVFPEARGRQVGHSLLRLSEHLAAEALATEISLMVGSFNVAARKLYENMGYMERARRGFVPFAGSDPDGHWILMVKKLRTVE